VRAALTLSPTPQRVPYPLIPSPLVRSRDTATICSQAGASSSFYLSSLESLSTSAADTDAPLKAALAQWASGYESAKRLQILTSSAPRAVAVSEALARAAGAAPPQRRSHLTPLSRSMLMSEVSTEPWGQEHDSFKSKFGESVWDLVGRLEPIALELESATTPVFIVAHEEHCRSLRAFLLRRIVHEARTQLDPSFVGSPLQLLDLYEENGMGFSETVVRLSPAVDFAMG